MRAWGRTFDEQVANLTMQIRVAPIKVPREVLNLGGVAALAVGNMHTCVLKRDGHVFCWGMNTLGQLGNGTTNASAAPAEVPGLTHIRAIAAGGLASCAENKDGRVFCWGQRGRGTAPPTVTSPREIPELRGATQLLLAVQREGGCAILSGRVACWGSNELNQLGDGPKDVYRERPTTIDGLSGVKQLGLGAFHGCALLETGSVRCWGYNNKGQLGDGFKETRLQPVEVRF